MIRNRSDQLGKNILQEALRSRGEAQTEAEVPPGDAQRIDVWFVPDETRARAGPSLEGILAALADSPALIELWSGGLHERELHSCLRKRYAWHHALEGRDKREWMMPPLWGICAGRPDGVLTGFGFEPAPEGPAGHYRTAAPALRMRLLVLSELPRSRDTILLRLLGRHAVRRQALADLEALPPDAFERQVAQPWLIRLGYDFSAADPATVSPDDREFVMDVHKWLEEHDREIGERFKQEGLSQGRLEGGLETLLHLFERKLRRHLTADERDRLAQKIREQGVDRISDLLLESSPEALGSWLFSKNGS